MKIRDVLKGKGNQVYTIRADQPIGDALAIIISQRVGTLIVAAADRPIEGIISERDILRHISDSGGSLGNRLVGDIMTPKEKLVVCTEDEDVNYAMQTMTKNRVRHLPVIGDGRLLGIVSIGDLVKSLLHHVEHENKMLQDYIAGVYPN